MHITDGFLDVKTWTILAIVSAIGVGLSVKKVNKDIGEKQIPLMGVMAAFVFVAQMINFPVPGGTSGHFLGGVLSVILLGPFAGLIVMSSVLIIQCLIFQDGGLTALGANIFNMGIIGAVVGWYIYISLSRLIKNDKGLFISAFIAAWVSTVLSAAACAVELGIAGIVPVKIAVVSMSIVYALIGIGEGLITAAALGFILNLRPDLLRMRKV